MSHYTYRAEWSPDEDQYIGLCLEFPFLKERGLEASQAVALVAEAVDRHVADLLASREEAPASLTERSYSGTFVVRTSTAMHARLKIEAQEQGISMNQWVIQKLSGRPPRDSLDAILND